MKKSVSKATDLTARPPEFPGLTKAQRSWISARRQELRSAIEAGIKSGEKDGYRAFDTDRILAFIEERRHDKPLKRAKRG